MAINDTIKYVTSAPKKVGAAITAAPKKIQQGAQNLADLPTKAYQRADEGVHQVATQFNNMKTMAIKSGHFVGPRQPIRVAHSAVGPDAQTGWVSQRTEKSKTYANETSAKEAFRTQSEALLRPGGWNDNSAGLTYADAPSWHLLKPDGTEEMQNRRIQKGDVLKIDAPGPDFFVRCDRLNVSKDNAQFTLVPCADPNDPSTQTKHFFTDGSSRTFMLQRDGNETRFVTEGNNERANVGAQSGGVGKALWNTASSALIVGGGGEGYWNLFGNGVMRK